MLSAMEVDSGNGIPALFGTAVQYFNNVQIARTVSRDATVYHLKLDVTRLRLSRWGKVAEISETESSSRDAAASNGLKIAEERQGDAEDFLFKIKELFENTQDDPANAGSSSALVTSQAQFFDPSKLSPRVKRVRNNITTIIEKRWARTDDEFSETKWAFYNKEYYENFMATLLELISNLEKLFPSEQEETLRGLCREEVEAISRGDLKALGEAISCDPLLEQLVNDAIGQQKSSQGTVNNLSAHDNYGIMTGIHNGDMKGLMFGSNNTSTHNWGADSKLSRF